MAGKSIKGLRWWIVFLIFLATTINYIDRQTISVAAPVITEEFGMTAQEYSWIISCFLLAYAIMQVVSGRLIDRWGTRRGFSIAIVWWSLANMAHALATGVRSLGFYRLLLGIGEAGNYPAAIKGISKWFPENERSMAVGILNAGPGLGSLLAPPIVAGLILTVGWRGAFIVTGAFGFVWLIAWLWLYREPEEHDRLDREELDLILAGRPQERGERTPWSQLLRHREIWGVTLARFVGDGAFYFIVFWLPKYLADERGFDIARIGMFAWIPFLAADLGSLYGGWLGKRYIDRGMSVDRSRKLTIWLGAVGVTVLMAAYFVPSAMMALAILGIAMFATQLKSSSLFALPADLVSPRDAAAGVGADRCRGEPRWHAVSAGRRLPGRQRFVRPGVCHRRTRPSPVGRDHQHHGT